MTHYRYAILSAVSTKKQAEGTSLDDQIQICRRMTERGWVETAGPYIVSGQNRTQYLNLRDAEKEIPAIRELLEDAKNKTYDILVIYDHDRLRSLLEIVYAALSDYRVQLFSVSAQNTPVPPEEYDPYENDTNDLLIGINQIKSKAEIARMRRKYRSGMRNRILIYGLPAQLPFGYRRPIIDQYNRKAIPEPIPEIAEHIIAIKDLYLLGKSTTDCIRHLNENGIHPPKSATWHHQTIRDIFRNSFYAGMVQFEKSKVQKDRRQNSKTRDRKIPEEKIITAQGKHTPLWDIPTHRALIAELKRRSRGFRGRQNNQFTGLVICGECGSAMWRQKNGPRAVKDRLIWRCSQAKAAHHSITHEDLLNDFGKTLMGNIAPHLSPLEADPPQRNKIVSDEDTLQKTKTERQRLEAAYIKGLFDIIRFETLIAPLDEKIKKLTAKIAARQVDEAQRQYNTSQLTKFMGSQYAPLIPSFLKNNDPEETNRLLHLMLQSITIHPDHIEIEYK